MEWRGADRIAVMRQEPELGDAFGEALLDAMTGGRGIHFIERDDGLLTAMDASLYFSKPAAWPKAEVTALERISGRVLDIGAGAGRHSVALQERGCEAMALDVSPGAIEVCRMRGVEWTFRGSIHELLGIPVEAFDSIILMGNNLGLLQSEARAVNLFSAMRQLLRPGGCVIGTCLDPYQTDDPNHLRYQDSNRAAGRYPGQIRMRFRYQRLATDWFGILYLAPDELTDLARSCGWQVLDMTEPDPEYVAVLRPR